MIVAALDGFLLGAGLIVAIGAQNAFVLRQGLKRQYVLIVCLICALSDALLIAAGIAGLGALVSASPGVLSAVTLIGSAFLFGYGLRAAMRAARPMSLRAAETAAPRLRDAVLASLAFTFLNPHVYLDTVVLLGSLAGRYEGAARVAYGLGAGAASFTWFFALGYGARLLAPVFADPRAWRVLDVVIALVMWTIAARLAFGL